MTSQTNNRRFPLLIAALLGLATVGAAVYLIIGGGNKPEDSGTPISSTETNETPAQPDRGNAAATETAKPASGPARAEAQTTSSHSPAPQTHLPANYVKALSGFSGRVIDQDDKPIKGAPVELLGGLLDLFTVSPEAVLFNNEDFDPKIEVQKVRTDENGKFNFERVDPRLFYALGVNLGGLGRPFVKFIDQTPNPTQHLDLGDLKLDEHFTITGKVVFEQGNKPVVNARVRAWTIPSAAFQAGIANINPDMSLLFAPSRKFGAQIWKMPNWMRKLFDKLPFPTGTTGSDGTFTIAGVPATGEVTIVVETANRPPVFQRVAVSKTPQKDAGEIVVPAGADVEGKVVDEHGNALANAEIMLGSPIPLAPKEGAFLRKAIRTNEKGQFNFSGVGGKQMILVARADGMTDWEVGELTDLTGDDVIMKVPAPRSVILTVQDETGKPAAIQKAVVSRNLDGPGMFPQFFPPLPAKMSNPEPGKYKINGLRSGKYTIYTTSEGYAIGRVIAEIPAEAGDLALTLQLEREQTIEVTVTANEDGKAVPLEAAHVGYAPRNDRTLENEGYYNIATAVTDARGVARLRAVKSGNIMITATHPGFAMSAVEAKVPETKQASVLLLKGGTIKGLLTKGGKVPDQPKLMIVSRQGAKDVGFQLPRFVLTTSDGSFETTHLAPGEYTVELSPFRVGDKNMAAFSTSFFERSFNFWEDRVSANVEVKDESVVECRLDMDKNNREATAGDGTIHGFVTLNGRPLSGATVYIYGTENRRVKTDEAGRYNTGAIRAGDWIQLNIQMTEDGNPWGNNLSSRSVKLKAAEDKEVNFNIITGGPLRGTVRSSVTNDILVGAQVQINKIIEHEAGKQAAEEENNYSYLHRQSNEKGEFEFKDIPEGKYQMTISAANHARFRQNNIIVKNGLAADSVNATLHAGVTVSGSITTDAGSGIKYSWSGLQFYQQGEQGGDSEWVQVETDMKFNTDSLTPGKYRVEFQAGATETGSNGKEKYIYLQFEPVEINVPAGGLRNTTLNFKKRSSGDPGAPQIIDASDEDK